MLVKPRHDQICGLISTKGQREIAKMLSLLGIAFTLLLELSGGVAAQAPSPPSSRNSGPSAKTELFRSGENATAQVHIGPNNKPCLNFLAYVEQQKVNNNIFNHVITVTNECSLIIKVDLCYYKSQRCTSIAVPAYGRKEVTLGIMPAMKDFRFQYKEKFDQGSVLGSPGIRLGP